MDCISRDVPINRDHAALLLIDVQNYSAHPAGGSFARLGEAGKEARKSFINLLESTMLPNSGAAAEGVSRRWARSDVHTIIENLAAVATVVGK